MLNLSLFKMGYIILYKNDKSIFGNLIVNKQLAAGFNPRDSEVTHVEISGGEKHSINISPPLSKLVDISQVHKERYIYLLRYKNEEYEKALRYKVAYFSATLCNKGYDIPGILSFLFKRIKQSRRLWFCSEGALWALQMGCKENILGIDPDRCMPAHFFGDEFEVVWEGKIE